MDTFVKLPRGKCFVCGKEVPIRSIREKNKAVFCSRSHASLGKYKARYSGANAGPSDRPENILDKAKQL